MDPSRRLTPSQILEHEWFARNGVICKPVYKIEINSSMGTSGAENDLQQSQQSRERSDTLDNGFTGIKPYQNIREELKHTIKT